MALKHDLIRFICQFPIRGRHRLVAALGGGGIAPLKIGDITLPLDLSVESERYVFFGLYESDYVAHLRRVLRAGDVFIDPGTNIGYISAVTAELVGPTGRVISLEPSRICHTRLSGYLKAEHVTLLHAALHSRSGTARFCDTPRVIERGFACLAEIEEPEDGDGYEIEVVSVDDLCAREGVARARYLKLDVEGAELMAIQGGTRMLAGGLIDFVLIETDFATPVTRDIDAAMQSHGYRPHRAQHDGSLSPLAADGRKGRFDVIWTAPGITA